jgi:signal transduction histidine kinase
MCSPPRWNGNDKLPKVSFWPRSLAARTAVVLLASLMLVQVAGLTIHALDRIDLQRIAQIRDVGVRVMGLYRSVALTPPAQRAAVVHELDLRDGSSVKLQTEPPAEELPLTAQPLRRQIVVSMQLVPVTQALRTREITMHGGFYYHRLIVGMRFPEGQWLNMWIPMPTQRPWHSMNFLVAFLGMTVAAALLTLWAVRRLTAPVRTLALAADALGRDVNAPPLPEDGPTEIATAAAAFNTMATRIRRFVQDRTFMLTAIGHDLRTPITRLKLRAEFMEDDELRRKMLADLDELESMVSATLAFGRDVTTDEPVGAIDLTELIRTILEEATDAHPDLAANISYGGPDHLPIHVRPVAVKRALTNLVMNALNYAASAHVTLTPAIAGQVTLTIDDTGPGIPPSELDRVFQPFQRVETSRNKETGGMGLGLPIARNILRAHGGDVTLGNRPGGGCRATVTLPA